MSDARTTFLGAAPHSPTGGLPGIQAGEASARQPWQEALGHWLGQLGEREEMRGLSERGRCDRSIAAYEVAFGCRQLPWRN